MKTLYNNNNNTIEQNDAMNRVYGSLSVGKGSTPQAARRS